MTAPSVPVVRARPQAVDIDLRRLRYFCTVCDHGGISKAATAIGIPQPALTRHIKLLEQQIGMPLILRSGRGVAPSRQGQFLLERSRALLDGLSDVVRDLRQVFSGTSGHLLLGICPTIVPLLLDDLLLHLKTSHPNVTVTVIRAYSGDLQSLMHAGRLDLALTYTSNRQPPFRSVELFSEPLVLVAGAGSRYGRIRSLQRLAQLKLILPSRIHELRRIIDRACEASAVRLQPALELDSLEAVKSALKRRVPRYCTILPQHSVAADVERGDLRLAGIEHPAMQRTIAVMTVPNHNNKILINALVRYLGEQAGRLKQRHSNLL